MNKAESAGYTAVLRMMRFYRRKYRELSPKPMTEARVIDILSIPDAELVRMLVDRANIPELESQAVSLCYRLGYTQEKAAEIMGRSRNAVYSYCRNGVHKLAEAWAGIKWLERI